MSSNFYEYFSLDEIKCDFQNDYCSWKPVASNPGSGFEYQRLTSQIINENGMTGPESAHSGSREDFFVFLTANGVGGGEKESAELKSAYFSTFQHPKECFQFWFNFEASFV